MRVRGAKNLGGGTLLSASGRDGVCAYVLSSGTVSARSVSGSSSVICAEAYCRLQSGSVTVKGGIPVYEEE